MLVLFVNNSVYDGVSERLPRVSLTDIRHLHGSYTGVLHVIMHVLIRGECTTYNYQGIYTYTPVHLSLIYPDT